MRFQCNSNPTKAVPTVLAALCMATLTSATLANKTSVPVDSLRTPGLGVQLATDGAGTVQNFESFTNGFGCGQQGWTGFCDGTTLPPVGFLIVDDSAAHPQFGSHTVKHVSDGSNVAGFEVISPVAASLQTGIIAADIVIGANTSLYQLVPVNNTSGFFNTRINFELNGTITALQTADCSAGTFSPTTGTWAPGELMRIASEIDGAGVLKIYKNNAVIFTGNDISQQCDAPSPDGMDQISLFASNATGTAQTAYFLMDNINESAAGLGACQVPLPNCRGDVGSASNGPPDGLVNVNDLLIVINTWGVNTFPNGPRPKGDCDPLPAGNCLVNVNDLLGVINTWGACPAVAGACCLPTGNCLGAQTQADCVSAGGTYMGNGKTCAQVVCLQPPANDNCQTATVVTNGTHAITNANASTSPQPLPDCLTSITRDVWFSYTATCNGNLTVDLCASTGGVFDSVLAVYTGTCPNGLGQVACNDDGCPATDSTLSKVTLPVASGTQYYIRVGSWAFDTSNAGPMSMTIGCATFNNDLCGDAEVITVGGQKSGTLGDATAEVPAPPNCQGVTPARGKWYTVISPTNQTLTADTCLSPGQSWDARLSIYCGSACATLSCVAAVNNDFCNLHESVSWCAKANQKYWIFVHSDDAANPEGAYTLRVTGGASCGTFAFCGIENDSCGGAQDITANIGGANVTGDNTTATPAATNDPEVPDTSPSCHWNATPTAVHHTVWYKFTAPASGNITVETCPSTTPFADSALALYSGSCGSLVEVACDDDSCSGDLFYSKILATGLTPGQTYYVMAACTGAWSGSVPGPYQLKIATFNICSWTCPPGSEQEGEPCLVDGNTTDTTNGGCNSTPTVYGSIAPNGPAKCGLISTYVFNNTSQRRDIDWYQFVAPLTGNYRLRLNAEFAGVSQLLTGTNPAGSACGTLAVVTNSTVATAGNCEEATSPALALTANVRYVVLVTFNTGFTGLPCGVNGQGNKYWVQLLQP